MRGIIIEGISASGKSSVLRHVHKRLHDEMPHSTKLFISEHYTQRMLEHALENNTLNSQMVKRHIDQIIDQLQMYQLMLDESKFTMKPSGAQAFVKKIEITNWDYKKVADTIYNNEYRECSNTIA